MYINFNAQLSTHVPLTAQGTFTVRLRIDWGNVEHVLYLDYAVSMSSYEEDTHTLTENSHHSLIILSLRSSRAGYLVPIIKKPEKVLILS